MQKLVQALALALVLLGAPALARAQDMQANTTGTVQVTPVAFPGSLEDVRNLSAGQAASILVGGSLGSLLAGSLLGGGVFGVVGAIVGAIGGNSWYEQRNWPF
jgi:outer membrane lipoprotein SlyB